MTGCTHFVVPIMVCQLLVEFYITIRLAKFDDHTKSVYSRKKHVMPRDHNIVNAYCTYLRA